MKREHQGSDELRQLRHRGHGGQKRTFFRGNRRGILLLLRHGSVTALLKLQRRRKFPGIIYNEFAMRRILILFLAAASLTGCKNAAVPSSTSSSAPADAVQKKLQELAGGGATDCGRFKTQAADQMKVASDCAMKAAQGKHAFYLAYDLPGLTVGVAGNGEGKLFALQAEQPNQAQPGAVADVKSAPCPAELRVAQSGRVTCVPVGSMGMNMGGSSPHGGEMTMPAAGGQSPHGGMIPAPGTPNPHSGGAAIPPKKP